MLYRVQYGLHELLDGPVGCEQEMALKVLANCVERFGNDALEELFAAGHAAAIAVEGFADGMTRSEVMRLLAALSAAIQFGLPPRPSAGVGSGAVMSIA